jgi:hypothetical protein
LAVQAGSGVYWSRYGLIVGGLVPAASGVVLFARPDVGAVTIALLFGLVGLVCGG